MNDLITLRVDGGVIDQRRADGYVNATAMCKMAGRDFYGYARTGPTKAFIEALSAETHICGSELIQSVRGGDPAFQGTWVHPKVAIHLAQWLSPQYAVWVTNLVFAWMTGQCDQDVEAFLRRNGGVMKAVVHKEIAEATAIVRQEVDELRQELVVVREELAATADPRKATGEYLSVTDALEERKALSRHRKSLRGRVFAIWKKECPRQQRRKCPRTGTWLFPIDFIEPWFRDRGGDRMIAEHNDRVRGQGSMHFTFSEGT